MGFEQLRLRIELGLAAINDDIRFKRGHLIFDLLDFSVDLRQHFFGSLDPLLNVYLLCLLNFPQILDVCWVLDGGAQLWGDDILLYFLNVVLSKAILFLDLNYQLSLFVDLDFGFNLLLRLLYFLRLLLELFLNFFGRDDISLFGLNDFI